MTTTKTTTIRILSSSEGDFIRAACDDGERDITTEGLDLTDADDVRFAVEQDLVGGWGADVDWSDVPVLDERG